jgi:phenylalanyl-tRNA synthetase beta chain
MRVSMKWLQELVTVDSTIPELVDRLDMTGTAVEAVHTAGEALDNVVVGLISEKVRHPEADKLWVTTIDVGDGDMRTIVCGAQNFEAGDKVPVALVGAILPGGFEIKKAKLRGVVSQGMNCSAKELGLGEDHDGLLILPADAPIGMSFAQYQGLSDTIIELEITPNRPDCLSMAGVAREIGALLERETVLPTGMPVETGGPISAECSVEITDSELCPRYAARVIRNVSIGPSPQWLADKVTAAGARPINNVVDVTNYVLFELGQPLHAFDMDTLARGEDGRVALSVRRARAGEKLTTLDGVERELSGSTLLICDPSGPVALAGVMGGEATEVADGTVNIVLESACFDPESISRTSRSMALISEASLRFERTVDRTSCIEALDRATALLVEVAGGEVAAGVVDVYPRPHAPTRLTLRLSRLKQILGVMIEDRDAAAILTRLGCTVAVHRDRLEVDVPSFRPDIEREIDLVEEVLRVWGMERVEPVLPTGSGRAGSLTAAQQWRERVGVIMRAAGLNETMTYAFTDPTDAARCDMRLGQGNVCVELLNPMSGEQAVLRQSLLPGLLRSVSYNQRRGVTDVHLYEIGSAFLTSEGRKQPREHSHLAAVMAGTWHQTEWNDPAVVLDFFDGKGVIENVAREMAFDRFKVRAVELDWLQPGRAAEIIVSGEVVGWLGEVHPAVLARFEADAPVVAFEMDLDKLIRSAKPARKFIEPARFPGIEHDIAVVVDESVSSERLEQSIRSAGGKLLETARVFDVYRGKGVQQGKKSIAFALVYRASDRTLTTEEVEAAHSKIVRKVLGAVGGELRG